MQYEVQIVGDDELPEGVHLLIVKQLDGETVMLLNGEPARAWEVVRAWEDTLEPCTVPTLLLPRPRHLAAV